MSGPSGAGKTSVCRELKKHPRVKFSVSATTRTPREHEREGVDYIFLDRDEFERRIEAGEFVEYAEYSGNYYGTLRGPMEEALAAGLVYVLEIEVQGARQLRDAGLDATFIFVAPPSLEEIRRRLVARGTDDAEEIDRRIAIAAREMEAKDMYNHVVVNRTLEQAIQEVAEHVGL